MALSWENWLWDHVERKWGEKDKTEMLCWSSKYLSVYALLVMQAIAEDGLFP